jgi:glycosyl hydrolase family 25
MRKKRFILVVLSFLTIMSVKAQYNIQCEDTCDHVHGLDMSHYQGDVWWETVAKNSNHKLNYVYLKATEGQSWVDKRY